MGKWGDPLSRPLCRSACWKGPAQLSLLKLQLQSPGRAERDTCPKPWRDAASQGLTTQQARDRLGQAASCEGRFTPVKANKASGPYKARCSCNDSSLCSPAAAPLSWGRGVYTPVAATSVWAEGRARV